MSESTTLLGVITQAQYEDWITRIAPRLDALAIQSRLLAEQFESLQKIATKLQSQTEAALTTILAEARR